MKLQFISASVVVLGALAGCSSESSSGTQSAGGSKSTAGRSASSSGNSGAVQSGGSAAASSVAATGAGAAAQGGSAPNAGGSSPGGVSAAGGIATVGGAAGTGARGGNPEAGASGARAGTSGAGAGSDAGGKSGIGGSGGATGKAGTGGGPGSGGGSGAGGSTGVPGIPGPCDIYQSANTRCVAAHSTVRALFGAYTGNLYQVKRASDNTTKDVPVLTPGGFANVSVQDTFCTGTTCTISILYDQSTYNNHLTKSPKAYWLPNGGVEAKASDAKITVGGHTVHGIYVTAYSNVAYRNNATKGVATGNQAESMYMVVDGKRFSNQCCFDYGNAETTGNDDGNGTMEAIYWGSDTGWGGYGQGNGPWVAADLENGMFKGNAGGWQYGDTHKTPWPTARSVIANYATTMLKGPATNQFTLKAGDAQSGSLTTMWDGVRPTPGYSPKKLQGAIILGTGGDGSNAGTGTFFEGAMTIGSPPDSVDAAIQANIVAAGYGK